MSYTKGKWFVDEGGNIVAENDGEPRTVAEVWEIENEEEANARLIASAPELLEACEELIKHLNPLAPIGVWRKGYDAIRKAKGESE